MLSYKNISLTVLLYLCVYACAAQLADSSRILPEAVVQATRATNSFSSSKTIIADSTLLVLNTPQTLADVLNQQGNIFIKAYGPNMLALPSLRGTSAQHTAIVWNGVNVQSPMNGVFDLSLMPAAFTDEVQIQFGGNAAVWGSGAVGGSIHLNNSHTFNKQGFSVLANTSLFDYNNSQSVLGFNYGGKNTAISVKGFYAVGDNAYRFMNDKLEQVMTNANMKQAGIQSNLFCKINSNQQIDAHFIYVDANRQVPSTIFEIANSKSQADAFTRSVINWKLIKEKIKYTAKVAHLYEAIIYSEPSINSISKGFANSFIAEGEFNFIPNKNISLNAGINNTFENAAVRDKNLSQENFYNADRNRFSFFSALNIKDNSRKVESVLSIRQEVVAGKFVPFTIAAGVSWQLINAIKIKVNVVRNYRLPTLNDLYWFQGGNPDLLAESGWGQDVGVVMKLNKNNFSFNAELTVFNRVMDNWIIWLPNGAFWSPRNILQVWSRGLETRWNVEYNSKQTRVGMILNSNYVISTNEKAKAENDVSIGRQLIYTPMYSGNINLYAIVKNWSVSYIQQYTGYRYTTSDNYSYLSPYWLSSFAIGKTINYRKLNVNISLQAHNLFNESYQVVSTRPMPLRNFQLSISVNFNNYKTNKNEN